MSTVKTRIETQKLDNYGPQLPSFIFAQHTIKYIVVLFVTAILLVTLIQVALAAPSVLLQIRSNKAVVEPGEAVTYNIRYRCASLTEHCEDVAIQDVVPAGMEIVSYSRQGGLVGAVSSSGNTVDWTLQSPNSPSGQLDAGSTGVLKVKARFPTCGTAVSAGTYTNNATLTLSNGTGSVAPVDVTLANPVPASCPAPPAPSGLEYRKLFYDIGQGVALGGSTFVFISQFPEHTGTYTITDEIQPGGVVQYFYESSANIYTEVECGDDGVWRTTPTSPGNIWTWFWPTNSNLIPPGCSYTEISPGEYVTNITAFRFTLNGTAEGLFWNFLMHFPEANPFDSADLPNFTPLQPGDTYQNCYVSNVTSMGNSGEACTQTRIVDPFAMPGVEKFMLGTPDNHWVDNPLHTPQATIEPLVPAEDVSSIPPRTQGPSDMVYRLQLTGYPYAGQDWVDPVVYELLPPELEYVTYAAGGTNWWQVNIEALLAGNAHHAPFYPGNQPGCLNPAFSAIPDYQGTGRTMLRWEFNNCTLSNQVLTEYEIAVDFSARIKAGVTAGTEIVNVAGAGTLQAGDWEVNGFHCGETMGTNNELRDPLDLDVDGDLIDAICYSNVVTYSVPIISDMQSSKWVQGSLDSEYSRFPLVGNTDEAGEATYQLLIENTGNVNVTQLDVVDILPHAGDNDVLGEIGPRDSAWAMALAGDILTEVSTDGGVIYTAIPASDLLNSGVLYADTLNPCRFTNNSSTGDDLDVLGNFPAGCTILDGATSASGATTFGFRYQPAAPFAPGSIMRLTIAIELDGNPPGCTDPACNGGIESVTSGAVAWNSFAYGGVYDNGGSTERLLNTEPIKVGVQMIDTTSFTSLGNYVWHDANGNGTQDTSEAPLAGVTVRLYEADGTTLVGTTTTDANGFYQFFGLDPNTTYVVKLDNASDYASGALSGFSLTVADQGSDATDSDAMYDINSYAVITTTTGAVTGISDPADPAEYPTNDFGFWQPASIGDTVWYDFDGTGDQSEGFGVDGVTVALFDAGADGIAGTGDDLPQGTQTTDANGNYLFDNLSPGNYFLTFDYSTISDTHPISGTTVNAADFVYTLADSTGDDTTDSDAAIVVGTVASTAVTYLEAGEVDRTWDAGLTPAPTPPANPVSVGNYVWEDRDADGQQDGDEPGYPGVTVQLLQGGFPIASTTTDGNGRYQFDNLDPAQSYQIVFLAPSGTTLTSSDSGSDLSDSDANPGTGETITFSPNENGDGSDNDDLDERWDAGIIPTLSLGNQVWDDVNDNGTFDAGENGIAGLTVNLLNAAGSVVVSTTTDANGRYLFDGLAPETYAVEVEQPAGFRLSSVNTSDAGDGLDDDNNGLNEINTGFVRSGDILLTFGDAPTNESDHGAPIDGGTDTTLNHNAYYTVDFGFFQPLEIGNYIWLDADNDGVQDVNESGIDDVTVQLIDATTGNVITTTTTISGGHYLFTDLAAGDYIVRVPVSNFGSGGALVGMFSTSIDIHNNVTRPVYDPDSVSSDTDNNGDDLNGTASLFAGATTTNIESTAITLVHLGEPATDEAPSSGILDLNSNLTVDFGFIPMSVRIGNRVWFDANDNGMDDGEAGIDGVTVELLDDGGTVISTTTTANGGYYLFTSDSNGDLLFSNDYQVRIPASNFGANQPLQYHQSSSVDGGDPDNNINLDDNGPGSGPGTAVTSALLTVTGGTEPTNDGDDGFGNLTVDFGFYLPPAELSLEKTLVAPTNGAAAIGDTVSYQLQIENTGQMTVTQLSLNDVYDASYLQFSSASIMPDITSTGVLTWTGTTTTGNLQSALPLASGETVTITVNFVAIEP